MLMITKTYSLNVRFIAKEVEGELEKDFVIGRIGG